MKTHEKAISAVAGTTNLSKEQVEHITTAYIEEMQKSGWSLVQGGLRLSVSSRGILSLENMLYAPTPS